MPPSPWGPDRQQAVRGESVPRGCLVVEGGPTDEEPTPAPPRLALVDLEGELEAEVYPGISPGQTAAASTPTPPVHSQTGVESTAPTTQH